MRVEIDGVTICLVHTSSDEWYALEDACSHEEFALSEGELSGLKLECVQHGSRFDVRTGNPDVLPATEPVRTFDIAVEDLNLYVEIATS